MAHEVGEILQVERLRHHPSIFVWAGNNENELGVRQWFFAANYSFVDSVSFIVFLNSVFSGVDII